MKKISILTIILLIIVLAGIFSACSIAADEEEDLSGVNLDGKYAQITYNNYVLYGTGHYVEYKLTYDYSFYQKNKKTLGELMDTLKSSFEKSGYSVSIDTVSGILSASLKFDTTEEYYRATGYNGFEIDSDSVDPEYDTIFYKEYTYSMQTIFKDIDKDYKYIGRIFYTGCIKAGITEKEVILLYVYGTPYKTKTIRSDADEVKYSSEDNLYYHYFYMNVSDKDRVITITQRTPNTTVWYVFAIIIGLVICVVPLTILLIKKRR